MARVQLESIRKVYDGGVEAVRSMDLDIADGEFLVLVGGSGCGKSTTLRMIAGLESITEGTIRIDGRVVNTVAPKDRDIAMVFQNYALYPHMTVYDNMAFALKMRKTPKAEIDRRVREAAAWLDITPILGRKPGALSGGQRQRVALGRAIVREPACFLFDEPLSNLDAKLRVATRGELKSLHQRLKTTSVYVTHDQEEAMTLGDRVCVMADGTIQQVDTPLMVYDRPVNRFVAGFIGTPPMNFVDGRLEQSGGGVAFVSADGLVRLSAAASHAEALRSAIGRTVVLGIRPPLFSEASADDSERLRATIDRIEPLGDQMDLHLRIGEHPITARMAARHGLSPGEPIDLAVRTEHCQYFEPGEYGANLVHASRGAVSSSVSAL